MKTYLTLFFITAAVAVTSSLPLSKIWDTKTQFLGQTGLLPQHDVVSTYSTRLPHEIKGSRESQTRPHLLKLKQTHVSMATAPVMSMDELFSIVQSILNLLPQLYQTVADVFYNIFREKYGINDPLSDETQKISDIIHQLANIANKATSCVVDDESRLLFASVANEMNEILASWEEYVLKERKIDISDCKVSSKVEVLDGFQPLFQVMKKYRAQSACIFLKRLADNSTVSEDTRNSYKDYFNTIKKLYENKILTKEEDKAALKKSMNFLLQKINDIQLSSIIKNAITQLSQELIKTMTGEESTALDKFLMLKNSAVLLIGYTSGSTNTLLQDRMAAPLYGALVPILVKISISEISKECKRRRDKELSYFPRQILTYILPKMKDFMSYFISHMSNPTPNIFPSKSRKMSSRQEFHEEQVDTKFRDLLSYIVSADKIQMHSIQMLTPADFQGEN